MIIRGMEDTKAKALLTLCARLSDIVYQNAAHAKETVLVEGFSEFHFMDAPLTDTQAMFVMKGDSAFIVFRGTSGRNWNDWKTNLDFVFGGCSIGLCHRGFYKDVMSVYESLADLIKSKALGRKLYITGHSQGGADAHVFAAEYLYDGGRIEKVITFGSPRVFDNDAALYLTSNYPETFVRVVNNNDIVTRVPPSLNGYRHIGDLVYFTEKGKCVIDPSIWTRFKEMVKGAYGDFGEIGLDGIKDHDIRENYLRLCQSIEV